MPRGSYAVSPHTGVFVLNPDDISGAARHPDCGRLNGCCGLDGLDGPNLVCDACGAEVATQQSDCWSQQLIALIPDAVTIAISPPPEPMKFRQYQARVRRNMCAFPKGLFEVTITLARSYLFEITWKNRFAASDSNGM